MVAHRKLDTVMHEVRQHLASESKNPFIGEDQKAKIASMQQLVTVFKRAGDDIFAYLKKDKFTVRIFLKVVLVSSLMFDGK